MYPVWFSFTWPPGRITLVTKSNTIKKSFIKNETVGIFDEIEVGTIAFVLIALPTPRTSLTTLIVRWRQIFDLPKLKWVAPKNFFPYWTCCFFIFSFPSSSLSSWWLLKLACSVNTENNYWNATISLKNLRFHRKRATKTTSAVTLMERIKRHQPILKTPEFILTAKKVKSMREKWKLLRLLLSVSYHYFIRPNYDGNTFLTSSVKPVFLSKYM